MTDAESKAQNPLIGVYGKPKLSLSRGEGVWLYDDQGKRYLDLLGGVAVNALGYCHPDIVAAISKQAGTLPHISNYFITDTVVQLAQSLISQLPADTYAKVFFCNSGTEANEAALKLSRLTGRTQVISAQNAFHGRTMGALSLTAQASKQTPFLPLLPDVIHVPYGDIAALTEAVSTETAAVFLEPIMGEAGVIVPPPGYLAHAREITRKHGVMLILDEVQTGIGRTGTFYASSAENIMPDVITLAKGLGGGLPLGAIIATGDYADAFQAGQHGSTFGGNPIAAAAGQVVVEHISAPGFLEKVQEIGEYFRTELEKISSPKIKAVRGRGLLIGLELREDIAAEIEQSALAQGFIINVTSPNTLRFAPPLIIIPEEIASFIACLTAILA